MSRQKKSQKSLVNSKTFSMLVALLAFLLVGFTFLFHQWQQDEVVFRGALTVSSDTTEEDEMREKTTARVMAHGDLLYHDIIYMSALQDDGTYDFNLNFEYVKPWFDQADLVIGDFEGTIAPELPLAGYPLFNAPKEVVDAIKNAGYDVMDLAHNHILDSYLSGLLSTAKAFEDAGIDTVGVYPEGNRSTAPPLIKEVNGIKIAILAYAYGFNGMEANLSVEEQANYLSNLDEVQMQKEIEAAEQAADVTIIMPQMGIEYSLEPTQEQITLYHKMIDWGADVVFGGHPHVAEPSETVEKDGQQKLIIYSMGNFISNQRMETMEGVANYQWTERGVLMDVVFEKTGDTTVIKTAKAHPTWVQRTPNGRYSPEGYTLYNYQTLILEDFIAGGKHRDLLDSETQARIDTAYTEMNDFMGLYWE
ncbi:CapA family protein [Streptococcus rifensis]